MSTREQDRRWGTGYCIQLEGEKSLPLGCTISLAPWKNKCPLCQLSPGQCIETPGVFLTDLHWGVGPSSWARGATCSICSALGISRTVVLMSMHHSRDQAQLPELLAPHSPCPKERMRTQSDHLRRTTDELNETSCAGSTIS